MFAQLPERSELSAEDITIARMHLDKYLMDNLSGTSQKLPDADLDPSGMIAFAMGLETLSAALNQCYPMAAKVAMDEATELREIARDLAK